MGILIEDTITFSNGLTSANCYCSFYNNTITIEKNEGVDSNYNIRGSATIWVNKTFREENKPILDRVNVSVSINASQLDTNVYTHLYDSLKEQYSTVTDDI